MADYIKSLYGYPLRDYEALHEDDKTALESKIAAEATRAQAAEQENANAISAETTRAKSAESSETTRAKAAEKTNADNISEEISRAKSAESYEATRAKAAEKTNADAISSEITRAKNAEASEKERAVYAETANSDKIDAEIERAKNAEKTNADAISTEKTRAEKAEKTNSTAIANEVTRAQSAEQANEDAIAAEKTRAKAAEQTNADAIAAEKSRAQRAEQTNSTSIQNEIARAVSADDANSSAISSEVTRAKSAEAEEKARAMYAEQTNADAIEDVKNSTYTKTVIDQKIAAATPEDYDEVKEQVEDNTLSLSGKVGYATYEDDNYLYLYASEDSTEPLAKVYIKSGGGGGGEGDSKLTVTNTSGFLSKTILKDNDLTLSFNWTSLRDDIPTGNGTLTIYCNDVSKGTFDIAQGDVSKNVKDYLGTGNNRLKFTITDVYGNLRSIIFSVKVVDAYITSTFDSGTAYSSAISYTYVPYGAIEKTIHFVLDGAEIGTEVTKASGVQFTYSIPKQAAGSHILKVYMTASLDEQTVESNVLQYELICISDESTDPIITTTCFDTTAKQYESKSIGFYVYDPASFTTEVDLIVGELIVSKLTDVDRTLHTWNYRFDTVGETTLKIVCGKTTKTFDFTVEKSDIDIEAETKDLSLYLSSKGRSNNDTNRSVWNYNTIESTLSGFNFVSDGWLHDENGFTVLRITGGARVEIPLKLFQNDFRSTGKTVEIEFATRDVLDYDSVVVSCMSGDRGLKYTAQMVDFASEQSSMYTQYKEDDHIRIAFVIEKKSENRLIYFYINGIMSGTVQYPEDDDFSQLNPVNISLGSDKCTLDIYNIRVYENDLTRNQILNNWIADSESIDDMLDRYNRNNIFDEYGVIVISKLPKDLPYMILNAAELPQSKGDKKTISGSYVNPSDTSKNFTFTDASFDVQGTSSAGYARKNYKGKFSGGFVLSDGTTSSTYQMRSNSIPTKTFTFKADVASSEGANNVELVGLYNETCPYKTVPQQENENIRQGIDGFPMVIFWNDGTNVTFLGKYNFNNDKGTPEVFGFASGDESWEVLNNTSDRVIFESDDYTGTDWKNDFEARYPEDNTDISNFAALASWIKSTKNDLDKFKSEFSDYFELNAMTFYYIFTEAFLMVDSRAKNMFPTKMGGSKWFMLPYDFDTALGINNEGALAFSYNLEDIDQVGGADVYNGQQSILWKNFREAFADEIKSMYATLRSGGIFNYTNIENRFDVHQGKWPEAIFNEDAYYKYIQPLIESGTSAYLSMLQGSKAEQRKWWLYNRFKYLDSKYNAGDSVGDIITLRAYAKGDISITPYADIYATVKYGSYLVQERAARNTEHTLICPLTTLNDTECYVYSCSQVSAIGDISPMKVGYADFSKAVKISTLKIGDSSDSYSNENLKELYLGNNVLLTSLDVRNCPNLTMSVDVSGCTNIEELYFEGTSVTGVSLPNGGQIKTLHLPSTITNLTIRNQTKLSDVQIGSYSNITTLRLENLDWTIINPFTILDVIAANSRIRLIGIEKSYDTADEIKAFYDLLDTFRGLDESGNTMDKAQVSGTISIDTITGSDYAALVARYSSITIKYNHISSIVTFYDNDMNLLGTATSVDGAAVTYSGSTPTKPTTAQYIYTFTGWATKNGGPAEDDALTNIKGDKTLYTAFNAELRYYTITFVNDSSGTSKTLQTGSYAYGSTPSYTGSTPTYEGTEEFGDFTGWSPAVTNVTGNQTYTASFMDLRSFTVAFVQRTITSYSDDELEKVGDYAFSGCSKLTSVDLPAATSIGDYAFSGCSALTSVDLPAATSIGANAFRNCSALTLLILRNTSKVCIYSTTASSADPSNANLKIYVPSALLESYKIATNWSRLASHFVALEGSEFE